MRRGLVCMLVAGCNWVYGLEETVLANLNPRIIVVDNSASLVDLEEFPLLISLDASRIVYSAVDDPGTQLRFTDDASGEDLPYEIERWNPAGTSTVWVEVAKLPARASEHRILMHYGAEARGTERPSDVWSAYAFAFHGRSDRFASSSGDYPGIAFGVASGDGPLGEAVRFSGSRGQRVEFAAPTLLDGWERFTVEMWLFADYEPDELVMNHVVWFKSDAIGARVSRVSSSVLQLDVLVMFAASATNQPMFVPIRRWTHVAITFDGQILWTYRDGVLADAENLAASVRLAATTAPLVVGSSTTTDAMRGMIDEVRVSDRYRDVHWLNAQYLTMTGRLVRFLEPGD